MMVLTTSFTKTKKHSLHEVGIRVDLLTFLSSFMWLQIELGKDRMPCLGRPIPQVANMECVASRATSLNATASAYRRMVYSNLKILERVSKEDCYILTTKVQILLRIK